MSDLTQRLQSAPFSPGGIQEMRNEAATEIKRLQTDNDTLRKIANDEAEISCELLEALKVAAEHITNRKAQEAAWRTIAKVEGK